MSVSNTNVNMSSGPELRGANITLDTILKPTDASLRQTKIICTLGPACWDVPTLETLIMAGLSVARFNFSHGDHKGHQECLDRLRIAVKNTNKYVGMSTSFSFDGCIVRKYIFTSLYLTFNTIFRCNVLANNITAVMLDTKGPEIRTGFFANGEKKITLNKGETLILTSDYEFLGDSKKIACSYAALAKSVTVGQQILVADGSLVLVVTSIDSASDEVHCRIENSCSIGERKNMNLPGVIVDLPTLTEKDIVDLQEWGVKNNVDFIAASFVRKPSDVIKIREVLGEAGKGIKIICKIENQEGMENYDEILKETDAIMVARGDVSKAAYCVSIVSRLPLTYLMAVVFPFRLRYSLGWKFHQKRFSLHRR